MRSRTSRWSIKAALVVIALLGPLLGPLPAARADIKTWVGTDPVNPNDWHDPDNWSPVGVPGSLDDVMIDDTASNSPIIDSGAALAASVHIEGPKDVYVNPGASMSTGSIDLVDSILNVSGSVLASGAVTATGPDAFINLNGPLTLSGTGIADGVFLSERAVLRQNGPVETKRLQVRSGARFEQLDGVLKITNYDVDDEGAFLADPFGTATIRFVATGTWSGISSSYARGGTHRFNDVQIDPGVT